MRVALRTEGPAREWHRRLGARLMDEGHVLRLERAPTRAQMPAGLRLLLAAERRLYGTSAQLFAPVAAPFVAVGETCDLALEPRFGGIAGEGALVAALLARRPPRVEILDVSSASARRLASGLPAVERPEILSSALDMVLARTIQLVERAVRSASGRVSPGTVSLEPAQPARGASPVAFFGQTLVSKVVARLGRPGGTREGWRIVTRRIEGEDVASAQTWTDSHFALLPNDGLGFQADPFLFTHGGRTCLFYEAFPYATRKGVIDMVELDSSGRPSAPQRVLERDVHLSYPFVFAHQGAVYMLPETSAARRVQLFRAAPFPNRWVADRVLVEDVVAADATLVSHEGRWWLFATQSGDGGSSWDALSLFHAPDPLGPWTPHARNPVLIDAGAARPAGAMWHADGALMRIAQDCRRRYGDGLAICRVDRLDMGGYAQTVVSRLAPPAGLGAGRIHTLNRADGFEAIDLEIQGAVKPRDSADPAIPRAPAHG